MKLEKTLTIRGAVLNKNQLEVYMEKIASDHILKNNSNKETFPIPRLKDNFLFITKTYDILNEHLKLGITIHPAGEWLLDNYYTIEEVVKSVLKELTPKKYANFLGIGNGAYEGYARIYILASEIVAYTDGKIDSHLLKLLLRAYQNKKTLNMDEIWNLGIFLNISLIENIRNICEKIYSSQMQKYKAESIIERLIEKSQNLKFKITPEYQKDLGYGEMKFPFIEHLSYRLKQYGKKAYPYLQILEEEVDKMGSNIPEIIKKEHYDIAYRKVSIGNCIKSLKDLQRINFLTIFEAINGVEELLKQDPAGIYEKMDFKTKEYYRNKIKEISKKTKISEIYITKKTLELANQYLEKETKNSKKSHVGYFLIADGIEELIKELQVKDYPERVKSKKKEKIYINVNLALTTIFSILVSFYFFQISKSLVFSILNFLFIWIPISEIVTQVLQYLLIKIVKPKTVPKLDYQHGIPEEDATIVVIPTILKNSEKIKELIRKLEVFYLANKSENLYFALLGDTSSSKKEIEDFDKEIVKTGIEEIEKLNKKYESSYFPKFHFLYRKRTWCESENCFLGWERKRGLLTQFNEYLLGKRQNDFKANTIDGWRNKDNKKNKIPKIKYVITLDADTNLILNSGLELVGAMSHILNKPILNEEKNKVISGTALIQPRVGLDLQIAQKSLFTKIFAGAGGTDFYTNAISDVYQDNFEEGIYTGKGIYNLEVFYQVLKEQIPENLVLSHDLLEGNYLRCFLVNDILLMDGYPVQYNSFSMRLSRWIRGDWQIIQWLKPKIKIQDGSQIQNPLNSISRYKIWDNLRRSLIEIFVLINLIFIGLTINNTIIALPILLIPIITIIFPTVLDLVNKIIYRKDGTKRQKRFEDKISQTVASLFRAGIGICVLPHKAYISAVAIGKTIYRLGVSKKNLLEWITSEEAEASSKSDLGSYYQQMSANSVLAVILFLLAWLTPVIFFKYLFLVLAIMWLIGPGIAWYISKEKQIVSKVDEIGTKDKEYLLEIAKRTWEYFKEYANPQNNYLPPDNYQEKRKPLVVNRTSSTNIGLGLMTVICAYDLQFISLQEALELLEKMLQTIQKLSKWNGHLYNWYQTDTLNPSMPRYISTVDSGNFVGYLYVLKQFLQENIDKENVERFCLPDRIQEVEELIKNTDFSYLYEEEKQLFSIGFNIEENKLTDSYYDLLASEARQTSLVAIAKKDVPAKHWNSLSRTLTTMDRYKGLVSWAGTAFEYLMPNMNILTYPGSLIEESSKFLILCQQKYAKQLGIPWGISESAYYLKDLNSNYQYKSFGIPWLGLKRGLADEMVVSSYGSLMALTQQPKEVIENAKQLEEQGAFGKYGFYEAIDYTPTRLPYGKKYEVVQTYMAHHQALILLAINNLLNKNVLPERFGKNPEIEAVEILLQERMPENVIITKEKKEKIEKIKYPAYSSYEERIYPKINEDLVVANVIANDNYSIAINQKGEGYSKYKNFYINRYKRTWDEEQGIVFFIKNIRSQKIWKNINSDSHKQEKYSICFTPDMDKFERVDENIKTNTKIITAPEDPVEIRQIQLTNLGNTEETLEVTSYLEPVLSEKWQDYSHRAFNNLFLKYEVLPDNQSLLVKRNKRGEKQTIALGVNLFTEAETVGDLEYEIDKDKLYGNTKQEIPKMIEDSKPFSKSIGLVTEPILALKRTIKIKPNEKAVLNLVICVHEEEEVVKKNLIYYQNTEVIDTIFDLSKARSEEEARYLGITGKDISNYEKMMGYLVYYNPMRSQRMQELEKREYPQMDLWKYGISGDLPILLVTIKEIGDIGIISEVLKAYDYMKMRKVEFDLVIINKEENTYEKYINEAIETQILNQHLAHQKNINGGIFVLEGVEDEELLKLKANLWIDAQEGNLTTILKDTEEEYLENKKDIGYENPTMQPQVEEKNSPLIEMEDLQYYNEFGGFTQTQDEYIMRINKNQNLPTTWSHVIANEHFGSVVTQNLGGFTWKDNSRLNRITAWSNNVVMDTPSEVIYLKDTQTGKTWSLGNVPMPDENDYFVTFGFGYAKCDHMSNGILQNLDIFVPTKENLKIHLITLKNKLPTKKKLKLVYYVRPVLGEDEEKTNEYIDLQWNANSNTIFAKNLYVQDMPPKVCYVSCSEKISSYTGNRDFFEGKGSLANPEALKKVGLNNENALGNNSCIAIQIEIELEAFESREIAFLLGEEDDITTAKEMAYRYSKTSTCRQARIEVKKFWDTMLKKVQVKTPVESTNILLNGWVAYQTICSRLWARTGFYQSGGAFGFRDQLQDTLGIKYLGSELMKNQIIKHSKHQFVEGDVEHWWHEETKRGIRTKFSDDLLWLPYVTYDYIRYTGDIGILDILTPYVQAPPLEPDQDERYDQHLPTDFEGSIYEHCIRAIEKSLNFGENGIPKIGSGDWNDGFSTVGNKGKGESVWLGFFLYAVLDRFIPICRQRGDEQRAVQYEQIQMKLRKSLNTKAWDGRWFKRAFTDDGDVLGSIENEECRIDSIAQSWSVISGAGDNDKKYISMESLENHLVDKENGIIKLFDPPFEKSKLNPGYIKSYLPGVRENGGQYTHAAIWAVIAQCLLGFGDKAYEFYRMINPIEHSRTKEAANKYKVESYVIAADIYGSGTLLGKGGWTWYTGSSSWYYKTGIEYILGLKINHSVLSVQPCIPSTWKEYSICYHYKSSIYSIKVKNPNGKQTGVTKFRMNGEEIAQKEIHMQDNGKVYEIEIEM